VDKSPVLVYARKKQHGMHYTIDEKDLLHKKKRIKENASRADAGAPVFVHAPYIFPLMLVTVDMAQENSVIAEYIKADLH